MLAKALLQEFEMEAESTRKLLNAIPDTALSFKPGDLSWTTAQLATHIATIYSWYAGTLSGSVFDMAKFDGPPRDMSSMESINKLFEANYADAKKALEAVTDESLGENWSMVVGEKVIIPPTPRGQVARSFLMNHLYHHRGEMIVYLRATGNKVPHMYGPVAEDEKKS